MISCDHNSIVWEQRKLSNVAEIIGGGTPSTTNSEYWDGDINWYAPAEIGEQIYVDESQRKITKLGLEKSSARMLPAGRTVLFTSRAGIGKTVILRSPACTNQGFQSMVLNDNTNPYFVYSMTNMIKEKAERVASGSTFAEISGKMLGNLEFMFPSKPEQDKIGAYFESIDNLITLHQRKLFQQIHESSVWEQRKLGDIGSMKRGKRFTPADYVESNGIPCIHYGQIYTEYGTVATKTISQLNPNLRNQLRYADPGNIIIAGTSEDSDTVCKAVAWMGNSQVAYHDDSFAYSSNEDSLFLAYFFQSEFFRAQKASVVYGVTVKRVNADALAGADILLPSIREQQRIGSLFLNIDNLITLHRRA